LASQRVDGPGDVGPEGLQCIIQVAVFLRIPIDLERPSKMIIRQKGIVGLGVSPGLQRSATLLWLTHGFTPLTSVGRALNANSE
jgi:hypothetical protein